MKKNFSLLLISAFTSMTLNADIGYGVDLKYGLTTLDSGDKYENHSLSADMVFDFGTDLKRRID